MRRVPKIFTRREVLAGIDSPPWTLVTSSSSSSSRLQSTPPTQPNPQASAELPLLQQQHSRSSDQGPPASTSSTSSSAASLSESPDEPVMAITRKFTFPEFKIAMRWMNIIADYAEKRNHHPEWSNVYNRVEVKLTTHSAGGVTGKDIDMAQFMDMAHKNHNTGT